MGSHSASRAPAARMWRAISSIPVRAALCLLGLAIAPAAVGTWAYWTDTATVSTGTISSGDLDLMVGEADGDQLGGQGGSWTHENLGVSDLLPGESNARRLTLTNAGTSPLLLTGTFSSSNNDLPGLRVSIVPGAAPANQTSTGLRIASCTDGDTPWVASAPVTGTPTPFPDEAVELAPGASVSTCAVVALDSSAANDQQGKSTVLTFAFDAVQPTP